MASKNKGEIVAAVSTDKELVAQRVGDANAIVQDFVTAIFSGVQGKVADLRADLEAGLAAARVKDAQGRLAEINAEVQRLADEAAAARDDVTFRLLIVQIAILKGSFAGRYAAAVSVVPGAADAAAVEKEVTKLFDGVINGIKARRKEADRPPVPAPAERLDTLAPGPTVIVRELPAAAPPAPEPAPAAEADPGSTAPPSASSAAAPEPFSAAAAPEPEPEVAPEPVAEAAEEPTPEPEPETPAEVAEEAGEPEATLVPQVGLPTSEPADRGSKHKSKHGSRRQFART